MAATLPQESFCKSQVLSAPTPAKYLHADSEMKELSQITFMINDYVHHGTLIPDECKCVYSGRKGVCLNL